MITDVQVVERRCAVDRDLLLSETDHLLRRFGRCDVIRLSENTNTDFRLRAEADEIWSPISGKGCFFLVDMREDSPSQECVMRIEFAEDLKQAILIPFGVARAIVCKRDALLVRFSTHQDNEHAEDRTISFDNLSKVLNL